VPKEISLTIYLDGEELITLLCTPTKLVHLLLGYLHSEGIIAGRSDVALMRVCGEESVAEVRLTNPGYVPPVRRTMGTGCGGGISFNPNVSKVDSAIVVSTGQVQFLMKQLNESAELYRRTGGVHSSALASPDGLIAVAEDIGRHNTLDKIMGECLMRDLSTEGRLLLTTGRISSEMLSKASRMGTPIIVSRSSPTDRSVSLAGELGITLIGYARGNRLSVYSHAERLEGAVSQ
jgi:FdhD protein